MRKSKRSWDRTGAAAVETAFCLPAFVLLTFGIIETCSAIFLRQALLVSAYEGARVSVVPGAKQADVEANVKYLLSLRNVKVSKIVIQPLNFATAPYGTLITVDVQAKASENSSGPKFFFANCLMSGKATMMKE